MENKIEELQNKINKLKQEIKKETSIAKDLASKYYTKHKNSYKFNKSEATIINNHYIKVSEKGKELRELVNELLSIMY